MIEGTLDSKIALVVAALAIFAMIIALYRNGALPKRGVIIVGAVLVAITGFLFSTL